MSGASREGRDTLTRGRREAHGVGTWPIAAAVAIAALALALRVCGLHWGLPDSLHSYSYHPDEFLIVGSALEVLRSGLPSLYNYPSFDIYLTAGFISVAIGCGASIEAGLYLAGRLATALMGTAAVGVSYWAGRTLFGGWAGLTAALLLCIAPLHAQHSHFATVDVPSTVFVAAALGFAGLVLQRGSLRDYLLAGAMSGLAAGTKYNAGLVILSAVAAHLFRRAPRLWSGRFWATLGCALGAFVISTPGVVLRWPAFVYGLGYELRHSALGHGLVFAGTGSGFVYTFASSLWYGLGPALALMAVAAVVYAVWTRERPALVVLAFAAPYYVLISLSEVRFARYSLPLFPALAMLSGWAVVGWMGSSRRMARGAAVASVIVVLALTLAYALSLVSVFAGPDPRNVAARWVLGNVPRGSRIGVLEVPWFYSPPLSKSLGFGTLPQRIKAAEDTPYDLVVLSQMSPGKWWSSGNRPGWFIVSDYEIADAERIGTSGSVTGSSRREANRILADLAIIRRHYVPVRRFGGRFSFPGLGTLPHDMRYVEPSISIYRLPR